MDEACADSVHRSQRYQLLSTMCASKTRSWQAVSTRPLGPSELVATGLLTPSTRPDAREPMVDLTPPHQTYFASALSIAAHTAGNTSFGARLPSTTTNLSE